MEAVNYSDFREKLKTYLDMSYNNHEAIVITRKEGKNMVVMSVEDYNSIMETNYLLSNEANAEHLFKSMKQAKEGRKIGVDIEELTKCE